MEISARSTHLNADNNRSTSFSPFSFRNAVCCFVLQPVSRTGGLSYCLGILSAPAHYMNAIPLLDTLLKQAISARASDIHLELKHSGAQARLRIDGLMVAREQYTHEQASALTNRIKVLSGLDISVQRKPQDGKFRYLTDEKEVDVRVSTLPTIHGEKLVLRVLDSSQGLLSVEKLQLPEDIKEPLLYSLKSCQGLFLFVGPTGSGKTTTLYALIQSLAAHSKNIVTIEDPVEYTLPEINQVQVNSLAGVSFATGLRAILRQDPDIILIGEIRDLETAEIAVQAALTGHLVLGTLHTRDSIEAVVRLSELGLPAFYISAALRGVLAQRLLPLYCPVCRGAKCPQCHNTGYSGRRALFEYLPITPKIQETINCGVGYNQIRSMAEKDCWASFGKGAEGMLQDPAIPPAVLNEFLTDIEGAICKKNSANSKGSP